MSFLSLYSRFYRVLNLTAILNPFDLIYLSHKFKAPLPTGSPFKQEGQTSWQFPPTCSLFIGLRVWRQTDQNRPVSCPRGHHFDSNPFLPPIPFFFFFILKKSSFLFSFLSPFFFSSSPVSSSQSLLTISHLFLSQYKYSVLPLFSFHMLLLNNNMAVELMVGFGDATTPTNFTPKMEENAAVSAVQEAASAGIQSVQNFLRLMSHTPNHQHSQDDSSASTTPNAIAGYEAVADSVVSKFKKVISLLDRSRTGHARFRRAPVLTTTPPPPPPPKVKPQHQDPSSSSPISVPQIQVKKQESVSAFKVYCPTPSPVVRLPPLPHNNSHQPSHPPNTFQAQQNTSSVVLKNGSVDRKDATTTINFAASPPISAANSYISSLTGDTESLQPSLSSGFQFTHMSQVSSAGKPPLSSSSLKRKCNSMEDSAMKCGSSSGRCHCSKKRLVLATDLKKSPLICLNWVWNIFYSLLNCEISMV